MIAEIHSSGICPSSIERLNMIVRGRMRPWPASFNSRYDIPSFLADSLFGKLDMTLLTSKQETLFMLKVEGTLDGPTLKIKLGYRVCFAKLLQEYLLQITHPSLKIKIKTEKLHNLTFLFLRRVVYPQKENFCFTHPKTVCLYSLLH